MKSFKFTTIFYIFCLNIAILSISLRNNIALAQNLPECLGAEEYLLYKYKIRHPIYYLNQKMIFFIVGLNKLDISDQFYKKYCSLTIFTKEKNKEFLRKKLNTMILFPSFKILKFLMTSKTKFPFITLKMRINLFLLFMSKLEQYSPRYDCLDKLFPLFKRFKINSRYIESIDEIKQINLSKREYNFIFNKLKNINILFNSCLKKVPKL